MRAATRIEGLGFEKALCVGRELELDEFRAELPLDRRELLAHDLGMSLWREHLERHEGLDAVDDLVAEAARAELFFPNFAGEALVSGLDVLFLRDQLAAADA